MSVLRLYNSLTKTVVDFVPLEPGKVRVYNCGPTVYKRQHIGNMRRFLSADFLRRTLEFLGYEVRDITNITDVGHLTQDDIDEGEDKIEKAAREAKTTPQEIADRELKRFQEDLVMLNIEPAHLYPRASAHIQEMQDLITELIAKKHAYQTSSGVYFDVTSFPTYGALSGNTLSTLEAGARVAVRGEKRHPADFVLWVVDNTHLQKWPSPWGVGYPGWHIECSAMSLKYLGPDIDIHTGGEDNRFPHHENEIAQSEGATGEQFVRVWMHNRHLQVGGKKLAKREGEQITLDTLTERGFSPLAFRLLVFSHHYQTKMDFSWEQMDVFTEHLKAIKQLLRRLHEASIQKGAAGEPDQNMVLQFRMALEDNLNTPQAWAVWLSFVSAAHKQLDGEGKGAASLLATLHAMDTVVGVADVLESEIAKETIPAPIQQLVREREEAKKVRDFVHADEIRARLTQEGYKVEDTSFGPRVIKV